MTRTEPRFIGEAAPAIGSVAVEYVESDYSLAMSRHEVADDVAAINDLVLGADEGGVVVRIDGYCPHGSWRRANLVVPEAPVGRLRKGSWGIPGVSVGLTPTRWPTYHDPGSGVLCIAEELDPTFDEAWRLLANVTVALRDGEIVGLWVEGIERPSLWNRWAPARWFA